MVSSKLLIASLLTGVLAASAAVPVRVDAAPAHIQNHIEKAHRALAAGDAAAAAALFTKAIESRSLGDLELATALVHRGRALQTASQYQKAIDDYSAALRLVKLPSPTRAATLYNRGLAYQRLALHELAIDDFTSALFINSGLAHAYYSRANTLRDAGQYLFALGDYEKAQRYGFPEAHLPLYGQAMTYAILGRKQNAEKFLRQALAVKPDFPAARRKLDELAASAPHQEHTPDAGSSYGRMADRIDEIVAASLSPIPADRVVRSAGKQPLPPPRQLLEAAAEVEFATLALPGHRSMSLSQLPSALAPAFIISERQDFRKDQARIAAGDDSDSLTIEPVSAPVAFNTGTVPPPAAPPPVTGWLVQINSQRREEAAWSAWSKMQAKHAKLLTGRSAVVVKADLGEDGVVFRLRIKDLPSRTDAESLCKGLRKRGQDCYVVRAGA
jgi:tetratricopeptide (TPR) repeat protein